jgi:hypothetical protein
MLWIGTKDGAASYDGRSWRILNMPSEIGQNSVDLILPASNGDLWFGISGGGIARRFPDGTWATYSTPHNSPDDLQVQFSELEEPDGRRTVGLLTGRAFTRFIDGAWVDDPEFPRRSRQRRQRRRRNLGALGRPARWPHGASSPWHLECLPCPVRRAI